LFFERDLLQSRILPIPTNNTPTPAPTPIPALAPEVSPLLAAATLLLEPDIKLVDATSEDCMIY
jgi:hypothetical protein